MITLSPAVLGSYTLVIEIESPTEIHVGALGRFVFEEGLYTYTGSAFGKSQSLRIRLARHLRDSKTARWHVDYLLRKGRVRAIVLCESESRLECLLNQAIGSRTKSVVVAKGFGSSDCNRGCPAHLYYHPESSLEGLVEELLAVYSSLGRNVQRLTRVYRSV